MKRIVLATTLFGLGIYLLAKNAVNLNICSYSTPSCVRLWDGIEGGFFFFVLVFAFSLITYFLSEKAFQAWWRFARVAGPIILILSLLINLELHHRSGDWLADLFDLPALILLYSIFTIGSLWQIWRNRK